MCLVCGLSASAALAPPHAGAQPQPGPSPGAIESADCQPLFGEISIGYGTTTLPHDSTTTDYSGVGFSLALGGFVTPKVALAGRVTGVVIDPYKRFVVGFIGPHVQAWATPNIFAGVGLGLGAIVPEWLGNSASLGASARIGYAFIGRGPNIAFEITHHALGYAGEYGADDKGITTLLAEVGYRVW